MDKRRWGARKEGRKEGRGMGEKREEGERMEDGKWREGQSKAMMEAIIGRAGVRIEGCTERER